MDSNISLLNRKWKLKDFDESLHSVLLNLAKRIAGDGEGASKFVSVNVLNAKNIIEAKKTYA